jgi:signal transduction histidine kinase
MQPRELEVLAHELSHPIDALGLLSHALRRRTIEGDGEEILDGIDLGLRQMRRQLASLLDVVRAQRCLTAPGRTEFPLGPLFEKLALQSSRLADDNGVSLTIMPSSACVVSDPTALEVILRNLLLNALFFAQGGRVLMGCRSRGETVEIQVWDDGVGIAPEDQAIIFEPLQKLKGDGDDSISGLGIGLTVVRDLARALGHELDMHSEITRGSVFSLTLPRAER